MKNKTLNTSWQRVSRWYHRTVSDQGSYYQRKIIFPRVLSLLNVRVGESVLDLGCGQGILSRYLGSDIQYLGLDLAADLIVFAQKQNHQPKHRFIKADITKSLPVNKQDFNYCTIILSLQNVAEPEKVIFNAWQHLKTNGKLLIVLNHPCFRIPRQSSWEIDEKNHTQYRRLNLYLSPLKIPIKIHPSQHSRGPLVWTWHWPLSGISLWLKKAAFVISEIQEWASDKTSLGTASKMENRARQEFPLFLALVCLKP